MTVTPRKSTSRARHLRREQTPAEKLLWSRLRDRRLGGAKFVRQDSIGPFIADFVCRERKLIVEVDGATHSSVSEAAYDLRRTAALEAQGYRVIRVQNAEVYAQLDDVLEAIRLALEVCGS